MAQSIIEIYNDLITAKTALSELDSLQPNVDSGQTFLDDLTSSSKVAVWRSMYFVVAVGIWSLQKLFDSHVVWIENRAKELIVGNVDWYAKIALEFQYGDPLEFNGTEYTYATVVPANQIVKLVAINQVNDNLFIKVANLDSGGDPVELSTPELESFEAYFNKRKFAGTKFTYISREADLLKIQYKVYVDPLLMNLNGELISNTSIKPVEDAINNYCKGLPFNGEFSVTQLTDQIQSAQGVVNPVYLSAQAKYGLNPYAPLGDYYTPNAGHLKVDPLAPLSSSIQYIYAS